MTERQAERTNNSQTDRSTVNWTHNISNGPNNQSTGPSTSQSDLRQSKGKSRVNRTN
ncbi:MAG: hypothetical protein PHR96_00720 [Clostridia bacterium]|nr:hypothetical protein [Clostridia bacterium]